MLIVKNDTKIRTLSSQRQGMIDFPWILIGLFRHASKASNPVRTLVKFAVYSLVPYLKKCYPPSGPSQEIPARFLTSSSCLRLRSTSMAFLSRSISIRNTSCWRFSVSMYPKAYRGSAPRDPILSLPPRGFRVDQWIQSVTNIQTARQDSKDGPGGNIFRSWEIG